MVYTDAFIEELIGCSKKIINPPKEAGIGRGSTKIKFTLASTDETFSFSAFISQNITFQENFSIGLVYHPIDAKGTIVLLRVNGSHGLNENIPHHEGPHVHLADANRINMGLRPEGKIETEVPYATIKDAIQYFINRINISAADKQKYFSDPKNQIHVNFESDE